MASGSRGPTRLSSCRLRSLVWAVAAVTIWVGTLAPPQAALARHRSGPVTVRGTVLQTFRNGFAFDSPSKGLFDVHVSRLTTYWEGGVRIKASKVQIGTHVGVRGYLRNRTFQAIRVTVYKTKGGSSPKGTTIRHAVVNGVAKSWIAVTYAKKHWRFVVNKLTIVKERNRPVRLTSAKRGQLADIRYYRAGGNLIAIRVTLLVIHIHHPKSHFEHGTVSQTLRGGFVLETIAGHPLKVSYRHHVFVGELVSVRGYEAKGRFIALRVRQVKKLPVKSHLVRGVIAGIQGSTLQLREPNSKLMFKLLGTTKIEVGLHRKSVRSLKSGQYVYVRFWWQGNTRIATTVHVYSSKSGHRKTGEVRGELLSAKHGVVVVKSGGRSTAIQVPSSAHIRAGSKRAGFSALRPGEQVSIHYFYSGATRIATSVHVYVSGVKGHTETGTLLSMQKGRLQLLDRGQIRTVYISGLTVISQNGQPANFHALEVGQRVRVTGPIDHQGRLHAGRIDILQPTSRGSGSFSGPITRLNHGRMTLRLAVGPSVTVQIKRNTNVTARRHPVPQGWLFSGPPATAYVLPNRDGTPVATLIDFRPKSHSVTGNVVAQSKRQIEVAERSNKTTWCDLRIASMTDASGKRLKQAGLGAHVKVTGFLLPWGREAALTVVVSHPTERMSGTVVTVHGQSLLMQRSSGQKVSLRFAKGVQAWSAKTHQSFPPAAIPVKTHISIHGVSQAHWILVSSASITLRTEYVSGIVAKLGKNSLMLEESASQSVQVHITKTTKIEVGRLAVTFGDVEVGDTVTVHAYPDASGGLLAHILVIHRKLISRTGDLSNLTSTSFDLVLRDGTALHFLVYPTTKVTQNGLTIPYADLLNGDHCHVEGHLRPDGNLDATRIDLK